ncbi:AraC family transcriptional regulator [Paenibacillus ginsengarvi]|uniref:AraC family transcriptional regulator n=1 Tax=Paenibacillus ginsengarvi TaxID=400777 RepID=A0A3B0BJ36_9BACL|nr:AraC family transcriptional regulator [Paenibacillus ginsengarvi]RKN71827.1 AraC family transcriptional regulator [Paenibacillus ginsengarvi]
MSGKFTRTKLHFRDNLYFMVYKTWENKAPDEYYHAHEGMELLYLHEGTGRLILNDRLYLLQPRTLIYFKPYQVHLLRYDIPRLRSIVKINLPLVKSYLPMFPQMSAFISLLEKNREGPQMFQLNPKQDHELNNQLGFLHHTLSSVPNHEKKEQFVISWMQFMSYLKTYVFTELAAEEGMMLRHSHHAEKVVVWIDEHYKEPFCLERLSENVHLSASYLSNLFRHYTGSTITEYIMKRRLDEARHLLAHTSLSIDQVGKQSGFPNPPYFSRCFKKRHTVTPQQYRAIVASHHESTQSETALTD